MTLSLGVSLKMYFGYAQTLTWCRTVATTLGDHPALRSGQVELFILPAFPALPAVAEIFAGTPIAVGGQDLWSVDQGAFTGEVSGSMLAELGSRFVEVGHAERRTLFGEDETIVADKLAAALRNGLVPVLCLGETEHGSAQVAGAECVRQLHSALQASQAAGLSGPVVIAYEPHWAIGAAEPASDDHIVAVCAALRSAVEALTEHRGSKIIYGGSAGPGLLTRLGTGTDGLFLGRFAHDPVALTAIVDEAQQLAGGLTSGVTR